MRRYEITWKENPKEYLHETFNNYNRALEFYYDTLQNFSDDVIMYDRINEKVIRSHTPTTKKKVKSKWKTIKYNN